MKMNPMTAYGAASTIFGAHAPQAQSPAVPNVAELFLRGGLARSVVNPHDMDYVLGQAGAGLNGLNGFSGSDYPVVGDLGFAHPGSYQDYLTKTGDGGWNSGLSAYGIVYSGPSAGLISGATSGYSALADMKDMGDAIADGLFTSLSNRTRRALENIDSITKSKSPFGGLPQSLEAQRVNYMNELTRLLREWQDAPTKARQLQQAAGGGSPGGASTVTTTPGTYNTTGSGNPAQANNDLALQLALQKAQLDAQATLEETRNKQMADQLALQTSSASTARGGMPGWVVPAAVGVVLVGGAVFFLSKKRK